MRGQWVHADTRDGIIDFINDWSYKSEIKPLRFVNWLGLSTSKYYHWKSRYGKNNEHNGCVPRGHWLEAWEREAILKFCSETPLAGYRRCSYMMLDQDIVAVSPSSVYRVLAQEGLMDRWAKKESKKGSGFVQPLSPHDHWHIDISYLNIKGTFYYLCSILDGCSRYIVHHEIRESMKEAEVEILLERAKEEFPDARPRIISDNGPQFIAKDFKEFIRVSGMTHVRTSPYYPQSNGKLERWHKTIKEECVRPGSPLSLEEARSLVEKYIQHYNEIRLHSAIGYVAPKDCLEGREKKIFAERQEKLQKAREKRKLKTGGLKNEA